MAQGLKSVSGSYHLIQRKRVVEIDSPSGTSSWAVRIYDLRSLKDIYNWVVAGCLHTIGIVAYELFLEQIVDCLTFSPSQEIVYATAY